MASGFLISLIVYDSISPLHSLAVWKWVAVEVINNVE